MQLNCRVVLSDPSDPLLAGPYNRALLDLWKGVSKYSGIDLGESGGILTQSLWPSYHLFTNMHETRMNIGHFYRLA